MGISKEALTWYCHFCNRDRPDYAISVVTKDITPPGLPPGTLRHNRRYCNDDPACIQAAREWQQEREPYVPGRTP
jgi:hypothetical protein